MTTTSRLPRLILLLAFAGAMSAANLYYSQPLLPIIAASLHATVDDIAYLPAVTQAGFALGIVALLPLADMLERRWLIACVLTCLSAALLLHALAPGKTIIYVASFLIGLTGVVPQLLTPFASGSVPPQMAGRAVGVVLSGILIGILVSKIAAGLVASTLGWRALYLIAAALTLGLAVTLSRVLPRSAAASGMRYLDLLRSTAALAMSEPRLRKHALFGAMTFASFMAFWSTYAIFLAQQFHYGPAIAGLFGFAGLAGSAAVSQAGAQVDKGRFSPICRLAGVLIVASFGLMLAFKTSIVALVVGIVLLDAGAGLSHAANQTSAFALRPEARGRINSVYMAAYFAGGALGTTCAATILRFAGWDGVCALGALLGAAILLGEGFSARLASKSLQGGRPLCTSVAAAEEA